MPNRYKNITDLDLELLKKKYTKNELDEVIKKIEEDYPVQYAIQDVEFLDVKILVDERVLIPRFETELLVYKLKSLIEKNGLENANILDLCTGSGCIAISLKSYFKDAKVLGIDASSDALDVAKENARLNKVDVSFDRKDVLNGLNLNSKYDIIVSNPPYVRVDEIVSKNTKYEPRMALYPGLDDILFYKRILDYSKDIVMPKSIIAFEIGSTQGKRIIEYAHKIFPDSKIVIEKDYNQLDRFLFIFTGCE